MSSELAPLLVLLKITVPPEGVHLQATKVSLDVSQLPTATLAFFAKLFIFTRAPFGTGLIVQISLLAGSQSKSSPLPELASLMERGKPYCAFTVS
ncbi:hypothetical protein [Dyella sp.]|uniref:hypothetical protein n=1 Tax=Dyella sp. TaxID=1869338 RepID=UPI002D79FA06|nr:hypothetical protein [Dyella sp.]HET7331302.1 hypothetical protein [Dyella sp.]